MSVNMHGDEHAIRLGTGSRAGDELFDLVDQEVQGLLIEGLEQMVVARELDVLGAGDVLRQVASGLDRNGPITDAMEDQGRRLDRRQHVPDVDLVVGPHQGEDGARTRRGPLQPAEPLDERLVVSTARGVDGTRTP